MVTNYSQSVLRKVLTLYLTHPEQLTVHEQEMGERICSCTLCDVLWVRRKKRIPQRCPKCHKHGWNRPLIEQMRAIDEAQAAQASVRAKGGS
jgi:hypothetical protein